MSDGRFRSLRGRPAREGAPRGDRRCPPPPAARPSSAAARRRLVAPALAVVVALALGAGPVLAGPAPLAPDPLVELRTRLLARIESPPDVDVAAPGDHAGFRAVLQSDLFVHRAVGPFDLHVMRAGALASQAAAERVAAKVGATLAEVVPVVERHFPARDGEQQLVGGRRFPIVVAESEGPDDTCFAELVALLDWAEDEPTGWKSEGNPVWSPDAATRETVRTWEVQLFDLGHELPRDQGTAFLEHGIGYYTLAHLAARALRQGAWGLVPPWLAQGLTDELDIQAFGEAWVGGDWWERQTPGWFRPGWSGFVPKGSSPPPPVTGPPANLGVKVVKTGDSWQHRSSSGERHWTDLAADRQSEAPASFRFMAETESFLPRDRAAARALLHLVTDLAPPQGDGLLARLDRRSDTPPDGMPRQAPLPVLFAEALGGVPAIAELEALSGREMLQRIGRPDLIAAFDELGAGEALALSDHREQGAWLYTFPIQQLDAARRRRVFELILEAEYAQQLHEWLLLGEVLDRAFGAALEASKAYPKRERDQEAVGESFWSALAAPPGAADEPSRSKRTRR